MPLKNIQQDPDHSWREEDGCSEPLLVAKSSRPLALHNSAAAGTGRSRRRSQELSQPWSTVAVVAAVTVCIGTVLNSLFAQHVNNRAPGYFYAAAVFNPASGLLCYPMILLGLNLLGWEKTRLRGATFCQTLKYGSAIGLCFSVTNMLIQYGRSGSAAGEPDVSTVLALILQKLVVPVTLGLEACIEQRLPTAWEASGTFILMGGVALTASMHGGGGGGGHGDALVSHNLKIASLVLSAVPLACGFLLVKFARRDLPTVSGTELWAVLCVPELLFSFPLAYASQGIVYGWDTPATTMSKNLWAGIACVAAGIQPPLSQWHGNATAMQCPDAALFTWLSLPPGYAFNLAIPVLVQKKGSTSVPLFRAVALPIAALLAMTEIDPTIHTPFSWEGVGGVLAAFAGLVVFYGKDVCALCGVKVVVDAGAGAGTRTGADVSADCALALAFPTGTHDRASSGEQADRTS